MKIWLLTSEFPPFYGGGISTYCLETCRMLSELNHEVTVITQDFSIAKNGFFACDEARLYKFNPDLLPTKKFLGYEANLSFGFCSVVEQLIEIEGKPDCIEMQDYMGIGYYLLQKKHIGNANLLGIKMVLTLHAPTFVYFVYNQVPRYRHPDFWTGEMEKFCILAADLCISPSKYIISEIEQYLDISKATIHVIPNPYCLKETDNDVSKYSKNELIFYGKFTAQKGCIELLKYCADLWDLGYAFKLRMIGGGNHLFYPKNEDLSVILQYKYKKYCQSGQLIFEGEIKPTQLTEKLSQAHVIVIPSIVDNLPYTVMETMAMGKVVLCSQQGGQSEIIEHGLNGFLFSHNESESFKKALDTIFNLSESELLKIGAQAKEQIKNKFNYSSIVEQKLELISSVNNQANRFFPRVNPKLNSQNEDYSFASEELTVVIPYYNMGKYLPDTIASIEFLNSVKEIIIVNDGSTDSLSLLTLKKYENHQKIRVINTKNQGLALARNTGANEVKTPFLAFLDPDDTIEKEYYPAAIEAMKRKDNISFVGCWVKYFGESNDCWPTFTPELPYVLLHNSMNTSSLVYKTPHFLQAGLNDPAMIYGMEDYESMLGMLAKGYFGLSIPELWFNYRVRNDSMAQAFTNNSKLYLYSLIAKKHKQLFACYAEELFMLLNSNGPSINIDNPTFRPDNYQVLGRKIRNNRLISIVKKNKLLRSFAKRIYKRISK